MQVLMWKILVGLLLKFVAAAATEFLNEWLVEIPGGKRAAEAVAKDHGFRLVKQLPEFPNIFYFRHFSVKKRSKRSSSLQQSVLEDQRVIWAEQQEVKIRTKRDLVVIDENDHASSIPFVRRPETSDTDTAAESEESALFNDPLWGVQWYLLDAPADSSSVNGRSMRAVDGSSSVSLNVYPAWKLGYTGHDVVVTILDDGLEKTHTDLMQNYDPEASININGNNRDPTPRYDNPSDTHHGTRCAGEVAMQANNNKCGVGIAFNARIGGVRMLDGTVTDRVEGEAFSFNNNYIDIYSSSWGPSDNGKTVEKPGSMASKAMERGVTEGRGGKGVIYVWASGNGGLNGDSCAYDGYASNVFTLAVGSTTESGHIPIYSEACPSVMAVTYSSGSFNEGKIISTDLMDSCTSSHTGTSASAPLAAGIMALVLEANPNLTWRDMKHLVAWTSDPFTLLRTQGWYVNGVGLLVHPVFGFGLMDAERLVTAARNWKTVPSKNKCIVKKAGVEDSVFSFRKPLVVPVRTKACQNTDSEIKYLEHVEVIISLSHVRRGVVRINLESPAGTKTVIAPQRAADTSTEGFNDWPFMSVHTWGENPFGTWTVTVESNTNSSFVMGSLSSIRMVFHGTTEEPSMTKTLREWRRKQTATALNAQTV